MKTTLQSQFEHEHKAWERSLEFFKQENALLKYRLSEMVDENESNGFLELAEYFQNELLQKDEMLKKLMKELQAFSDHFNVLENGKRLSATIVSRQDKLRDDILQFEKKFLHLSKEFNKQMLQSI